MLKAKHIPLEAVIGSNGLFVDGDWIESKNQNPNGEIRLIQLADIGVGEFLNKSSRFMTLEKSKELRCTYLKKGDILIARMPDPIGRTCIFPGDPNKTCVTVVDVCVLRLSNLEVNSNWLMRYINSDNFKFNIKNYITGTTRQRISRKNLGSIEIPLPPLEEQKRIAAILDKADNLRRKRQQAIDLANQFLRSVFLDMFGDPVGNPKKWNLETLGKNAKIQIGPFGTQLHKEDYIIGGIPLINPSHIIDGKIVSNYNLSITQEKHAQLPEYHLEKNDIVMGRRGEMSRCAIVSEIENGWMCGTGSLIIRIDNRRFDTSYLFGVLTSKGIKSYLEAESLGATMPNLNKEIISKIRIPIPPLAMQIKYKEIVTRQKSILNKLLKAGSGKNELFDSLSQKAFSGKL